MPSKLLPYFSTYSWPGNVRQLERIRRTHYPAQPENEITLEELPEILRFKAPQDVVAPLDLPEEGISPGGGGERHCAKFSGNQTNTARYCR